MMLEFVEENEIDMIVSALQQDLMTLKYDDFTWVYDRQSYPPIRLNVNYSKDGTSESGRKYPASSRSITESETYYITDKFVNTIDVLMELGYDIDLAADEIEAVGIAFGEIGNHPLAKAVAQHHQAALGLRPIYF